MKHAAVIGDLVESKKEKAHVHAFYNWTEAGHCRADAHSHETVFADWCVEETHFAIFLVESVTDFV